MSGDFMRDWFTLVLAFTIGTAPFFIYMGSMRAFGFKHEEGISPPVGCTIFALLLLVCSIPIGYWCFTTFVVDWR